MDNGLTVVEIVPVIPTALTERAGVAEEDRMPFALARDLV